MRYFLGIMGIIGFKKHEHTRFECFSNADWAGSKEDSKSTSGYCVFFKEI